MQFYKCALFCAVLACLLLDPITARKGFGGGGSRHSYPKSGGLSGGGGGHGYPSSGGLSGGGHGYPSSGGSHGYPSSGGSHGYPSSGSNSHGYPASGGLSGNSQARPAGGNHAYPSSGGSHGYPGSSGLSGNSNRGTAGSTTNVHHHYHYNPPQSIAYTSNGRRVEYPVYHGTPPTYVYKYKDSGSKYGTLLTGLALLNLGALGATAYAFSQSHGNSGSSGSYGSGSYKAQPGEVCKFGLKTKTSREETRIDCNLILNFILAEQAKNQTTQQNRTIITSTTTVTNMTIVNNTDAVQETTTQKVLYEQLPNGTFVAVTSIPVNTTEPPAVSNASNPIQQSVVTTTTNTTTTVVDALDVKGTPVEVTPDMECYVIRTTPTTSMRKDVPCQLLQTYADKSIQRNAASRSFPTFAVLTAVLAAFLIN
ncbi:hypothetical protein O0L34_g7304 [Tuta absoluta]|nr:hypothetical protein O0L34_g7304 [Tuta absoluta]